MVFGGVVVGVAILITGVGAGPDRAALKDEKQVISYALGMNLAVQFKAQAVEIDEESLTRGLKDALSGRKTLLTDSQVRTLLAGLRERLKRTPRTLHGDAARSRAEIAEANRKAGEAFLAANKGRHGVITLESGLQYKVLQAGTGPKPTMADRVVIHYRGTSVDGSEFDSSYRNDRPATFAVSRMVKGWSEALQRMPVGSKWQLVIPSRLAYGEQGAGGSIGPNATLIFDVELLSIVESQGTAAETESRAEVPDVVAEQERGSSTAGSGVSRLVVSFRMDPRLATGTYGAKDRWVSPATFTKVGEGDTCTVDVRARGVDAGRKAVAIDPTWAPSDPDMITITPGEGGDARMLVLHPGESTVRVSSDGVALELGIKAALQNSVLQVSISQK